MDFESIFKIAVVALLTLAVPTALYFAVRVGLAFTRRLEIERSPDADVSAQLQALQARVTELEERVDFSERLLTEGRRS